MKACWQCELYVQYNHSSKTKLSSKYDILFHVKDQKIGLKLKKCIDCVGIYDWEKRTTLNNMKIKTLSKNDQ